MHRDVTTSRNTPGWVERWARVKHPCAQWPQLMSEVQRHPHQQPFLQHSFGWLYQGLWWLHEVWNENILEEHSLKTSTWMGPMTLDHKQPATMWCLDATQTCIWPHPVGLTYLLASAIQKFFVFQHGCNNLRPQACPKLALMSAHVRSCTYAQQGRSKT